MAKGTLVNQALEKLRQFEQGNTVQPGMFSTLDEIVAKAPFDVNSIDQWKAYLKPGRMLKREGVQFPLKKEELEWSGIEDLLPLNPTLTKAELREMLSENRQGFDVTMGREHSAGDIGPVDPIPESWNLGERDPLPPRIFVENPKYGVDYAGDTDSRLFHASPDSIYEESITGMPGLQHQSHFDPDTLSWSRTTTHNIENPSYQPSSGQTRRYDKVRLVEEIQSDLHSSAAEKLWTDPETKLYYTHEQFNNPRYQIKDREKLVSARRGYNDPNKMRNLNDEMHELIEAEDSWTPAESDMYKRLELLRSKMASAPQNAPYKNPRDYAGLELRKQLLNAVDNDENYLALVRGRDQIERYHQGMDPKARVGMEKMYDEVYSSELRKLAKRYGAVIEDVEVPVSTGADVRPSTMVELEMESVDDLRDMVQLSIDESTSLGEVRTSFDDYINDVYHVRADMEGSGLYDEFTGLIKDLEGVKSTLEVNFGDSMSDIGDAREVYSSAAEEFGVLHNKFRYLYDKYEFQTGGGSGTVTKNFPAIKLTDEVKEKVRRLGVPQYAEGGVVKMANGGLSVFSNILRRGDNELSEAEYAQVMASLSETEDERVLQEKLGTGKYWWDAVKHLPSAFLARMRKVHPETGEVRWIGRADEPDIELVARGLMTMDEWREETEAARKYNEASGEFRSTWLDDFRSMGALPPMLGNLLGEYTPLPGSLSDPEEAFQYPEWAVEAGERVGRSERASQEAFGLEDPTGFVQHLTSAGGAMASQLPVPAGPLRSAAMSVAEKIPQVARTVAKPITAPLSAAMEFINPTIIPSAKNYVMGTGFGAALGTGLEPSGEDIRGIEDRQREYDSMREKIDVVSREGWDELDEETRVSIMYSPFAEVAMKNLTDEQRLEMIEVLDEIGAFE